MRQIMLGTLVILTGVFWSKLLYATTTDVSGEQAIDFGPTNNSLFIMPNDPANMGMLDGSVNLYTGQHAESFPLLSLSGRKGFGINVSLDYDGNVSRVVRSKNWEAQASPVGLGFTLGSQSIVANHYNTTNLADDDYTLIINTQSLALKCVENNRYITNEGHPWQILRHVDTLDNIPIVIGWTIKKEDGTVYRFGDFNDSSLTGLNATRCIHRYGGYVGNGHTDDDELFPCVWDLRMIHDPDTLNWIKYSYLHELDNLCVVDSTGSLAYTKGYVRASYIETISLSDSSKVIFEYSNRSDYREFYGVNIYEYYYKKKLDKIYAVGTQGDTLTIIKFSYSTMGSGDFAKLKLNEVTYNSGDDNQYLLPLRFFYYTDSDDPEYFRIKEIRYPSGSTKNIYYTQISAAENLSSLDVDVMDNTTYDSKHLVTKNMILSDLNYGSQSYKSIRYWDGYWHEEGLSCASYLQIDKHGISPEGWAVVYDRICGDLIVKRWMGGYFETDTLSDHISCGASQNVDIFTDKDGFLVIVCDFDYPSGTERIKAAWYYRWNGKNWKKFDLGTWSTDDYHLGGVQLYNGMFGISYHYYSEPGHYPQSRLKYGKYVIEGDSIASQLTGNMEHYELGDRFSAGVNHVAFLAVHAAYVQEWRDSVWISHEFKRTDPYFDYKSICFIPDGIAFAYNDANGQWAYLSLAVFDQDGFREIGTPVYPSLGYHVIDRLWTSSHSIVAHFDGYWLLQDSTGLFEWNGTNWVYDHTIEIYGPYKNYPQLRNDSYAFGQPQDMHWRDFTLSARRYLGNLDWSNDLINLDLYNGGSDNDRWGYSSGDNYVICHDDYANKIFIYNPFHWGEQYVCDTVNLTGIYASMFYAAGDVFFVSSTFGSESNNMTAYKMVDTLYAGKPELTVVDSVCFYKWETYPYPLILNYSYYAGKLDQSATTPRFTKAVVSLPYYDQGDGPDGYNVTYYYNDLSDTSIVDGHIAANVTIPDLEGVVEDTIIFGIPNGGYWLDGMPFLTYSYSSDSGTSENVDYTYYYYRLYKTRDSAYVNDVYHKLLDSTISRTNGMISKTTNYYDLNNVQVEKTITDHKDGSYYAKGVKFAYSDNQGMDNDNAIVAVSLDSSYYYDYSGDSTILISKSGQYYEKHGNWVPVQSYTFRDFNDFTDTLYTLNDLIFDDNGNVIASVDIYGDTSWTKYDKEGLRPVASAYNCSGKEFLVQSFEEGTDWDNWYSVPDGETIWLDSMNAFTGNYCLGLHSNGNKVWGASNYIDADDLTDSLYYVSAWIKTNSIGQIYVQCCNAQGEAPGSAYKILSYGEQDCEDDSGWVKIEKIFNINDVPVGHVVDHLSIYLVQYGDGTCTENYVYFDDFRFHPVGGQVSAVVYDKSTGLVSAELGRNNIPTRNEYDDFFRLTATKDYKNNTTMEKEYFEFLGPLDEENTARAGFIIYPGYDSVDVAVPLTIDSTQFRACFMFGIFDPNGTVRTAIYLNHSLTPFWDTIFTSQDNPPDSVEYTGYLDVESGDTVSLVAEWQSTTWLGWCTLTHSMTSDSTYPAAVKTISYVSSEEVTMPVTTYEFYDNFGRKLQTRSTNYIIEGNDTIEAPLVSGMAEYDARGRVVKQFKPYYDLIGEAGVSAFSPWDSMLAEVDNYYDGTNAVGCDGRPYMEKSYYPDVRGQLKEVAGPGDSATWWFGLGHTTSYIYEPDLSANVMKTTTYDPDSGWTVSVSDRWGLYTRDTAYYITENSQQDSTAFVITTSYNNVKGQTESVWISDGVDSAEIRHYSYSDLGQVVKEWRVDYGNIHMKYDKAGNLRFMQNDKRQEEAIFVYFKYDEFGRKIEEGLCDTLINDSSSFTQSFADLRNFPEDDLEDSSKTVKYRWRYDMAEDSSLHYGQLTRVENTDASYFREFYSFPFDYKDSVVVNLMIDGGDKKSFVHEFDPLSGNIQKFKFYPYEGTAGARAQLYLYDKSGRLNAIRECDLDTNYEYSRDYATYSYFADGSLDSIVLGRYADDTDTSYAQKLKYSYDSRGLLIAINDTSEVAGSLYSNTCHFGLNMQYYDTPTGEGYFNGRVWRIGNANSNSSPGVTYSKYTYIINNLGWLVSATDAYNTINNRQYNYNYLGNRTFLKRGYNPLHYYEYQYNSATNGSSRLDHIDSVLFTPTSIMTFEYDTLGNTIDIPERPVINQTYDYRNLLTYSEMDTTYEGGPANRLDFAYDDAGLRIRKSYHYYWRESTGPGGGIDGLDGLDGEGGGGGEYEYYSQHPQWHYLYDGGVLVAIFDKNDDETQVYINGSDGPAAVYDANDDAKRYYFVRDQIGSTRVLVADTGDVVQYVNYHPFGDLKLGWSSYNDPLKFTGKERDKHRTFDYSYFGARYYDPQLGVFSTIDKAGQLASGFNYCSNNPIQMVDPDGQWILPALYYAYQAYQYYSLARTTWNVMHNGFGTPNQMFGTFAGIGMGFIPAPGSSNIYKNIASHAGMAAGRTIISNGISQHGFDKGRWDAGLLGSTAEGAVGGFMSSEQMQNYMFAKDPAGDNWRLFKTNRYMKARNEAWWMRHYAEIGGPLYAQVDINEIGWAILKRDMQYQWDKYVGPYFGGHSVMAGLEYYASFGGGLYVAYYDGEFYLVIRAGVGIGVKSVTPAASIGGAGAPSRFAFYGTAAFMHGIDVTYDPFSGKLRPAYAPGILLAGGGQLALPFSSLQSPASQYKYGVPEPSRMNRYIPVY